MYSKIVLIIYSDIDLELALQKVNNANFDLVPSDSIYKDDAQVNNDWLNINFVLKLRINIARIDTRTEAATLQERLVLTNANTWLAQPSDDFTETAACDTWGQSFEWFCNYQWHFQDQEWQRYVHKAALSDEWD